MEDSDDQYEDYHDERAPQYTKILDLTNGEGGERRPPRTITENLPQHHPKYHRSDRGEMDMEEYVEDEDEQDEEIDMARTEVTQVMDSCSSRDGTEGGGGGGFTVLSKGGGGGKVALNPNTPGKVVESGQEQTGRWTKQEHEAFLEALRMYGKEWKKVAAKVKTRTVVQTRTHAQKYFQKLQKLQETSGSTTDVDFVDMGLEGSASKPSRSSTGGGGSSTSHNIIITSGGVASRSNGVATSSHQKSKKQRPQPLQPPPPPIASSSATSSTVGLLAGLKGTRRGSTSTINAAQVISKMSAANVNPAVATSSLLSATRLAPSSGSAGSSRNPFLTDARPSSRPQHIFSTAMVDDDIAMTAPYSVSSLAATATGGWAAATSSSATATTTTMAPMTTTTASMKIVAPDPMNTLKKGKFPEPSPAATGKRKLAEIAAARMLAGVAGGVVPSSTKQSSSIFSSSSSSSSGPPSRVANAAALTTQLTASDHPFDLDKNNNINDPDQNREDGIPTPPPSEADFATTTSAAVEGDILSLNEPPLPPLFISEASDPATTLLPHRKQGLSLQIVNPESLGVTHEKRRKNGNEGDNSPVTPWDGQLEALVNEKAKSSSNNTQQASEMDTVTAAKVGIVQDEELPPVCGPGSAFGRSKLHGAICDMDLNLLQVQLREITINKSDVDLLARLDDAGFAPLHTAAALRLRHPDYSPLALEIVRKLLLAGANPNIQDKDGNTPLHWSARAGDHEVSAHLLIRNSQLNAKSKRGDTPLHWAVRGGRMGINVMALLVESGARVDAVDNKFKKPIDVAAEGYLDSESSIASLKARDGVHDTAGGGKMSRELKKLLREKLNEISETRSQLFERSHSCRTLVLHHPECLEHVAKSQADWEAPDRVVAIMTRVSQPNNLNGEEEIRDHEITLSSEFERANLDLLSRVHSTDYLQFVQTLSKDLEKQVRDAGGGGYGDEDGEGKAHVVPFTPMVQRSMIKVSESAVKSVSNSDTAFSAGSLRAARRAAGAVQHAVDCVLVGRNRNSFCAVRPPGHHAGVNGLLDGGESCGFCIFNNAAAGALYAISDERLLCDRCAIVDIDVHHGNGTEEIVRKCHDPSKLFFFSIHLYDNDKRRRGSSQFNYKFYPGTGSEDDLALNIINVPMVPLWKESVTPSQPITRTHNTRQKARTSDQEDESPVGTPQKSGQSSDAGSESGGGNAPSSPPPPSNSDYGTPPPSGRVAYREAIQNRLLPALRAFNPDLIIISAGFDAAKSDVGNARHERGGRERIGLDLVPEDYAWTTRKILEIADICCSGRVVSVLEGGYGRSQPNQSDASELPRSLDRSIFSECAVRHLHALIDPYDLERRFSAIH